MLNDDDKPSRKSPHNAARAGVEVRTRGPRRPARPTPVRAPRGGNWAPAILATFFGVGCAPAFDPPSLVTETRVVGARVEASGADNRASPAPGEGANVTWLVTAPAATPPLQWAFALCKPGLPSSLDCGELPFATFTGAGAAPVIPITVPPADALGGASRLLLYGRICDDAAPAFDPLTGHPACAGGALGTTATVAINLQTTADANHNPTAEGTFTFDGQPWPAGEDPCVNGPRVAAGTEAHVIGLVAPGADRERYTAIVGDPPVATPKREALQISAFTTAGKLKTPYLFVEADDPRELTPLEVKWNAPDEPAVTVETAITFTFVVRDDRGGTAWTTRSACVTGTDAQH
jgi:hypothetical protein